MSGTSKWGGGPLGRRRIALAGAAATLTLLAVVGCASTVSGSASPDPNAAPAPGPSSQSSSASSGSSTSSESSSSGSSSRSTESSSSSESSSESSSASSGSDPSSTETGSTSFTANPDNLPLTAPGTVLKYGDQALLPIVWLGEQGVFSFNNLTVTQGTTADWATLGNDPADAQGEVPWYIKVTLKQESGGDFVYASIDGELTAYAADGDYISLAFAGDTDNPLCPYRYPEDGFTVGSSYDACIVLAVNEGEAVDNVQYAGTFELDNDPYSDKPVVWKG